MNFALAEIAVTFGRFIELRMRPLWPQDSTLNLSDVFIHTEPTTKMEILSSVHIQVSLP
jgi:hypothetical protein